MLSAFQKPTAKGRWGAAENAPEESGCTHSTLLLKILRVKLKSQSQPAFEIEGPISVSVDVWAKSQSQLASEIEIGPNLSLSRRPKLRHVTRGYQNVRFLDPDKSSAPCSVSWRRGYRKEVHGRHRPLVGDRSLDRSRTQQTRVDTSRQHGTSCALPQYTPYTWSRIFIM